MLDIKLIRENPAHVKQNITNRRVDPKKADIDRLLELDSKKLKISQNIQELRTKRNIIAEKSKDASERTPESLRAGKDIRDQLEKLETELNLVQTDWQLIMDWIPNILASDVPFGKDDADNPETKAWSPKDGYFSKDKLGLKDFSKTWMPTHDFSGLHHVDIGKNLDIIDTEQKFFGFR